MMVDKVKKRMAQDQSLEAIWADHGDEFPVYVHTFYGYVEKGVIGLANIELPKKVKYAPRRRREEGALKMDLAGRTYADWLALPAGLLDGLGIAAVPPDDVVMRPSLLGL